MTDANLLLGYLGDGAELGGELTLDARARRGGARGARRRRSASTRSRPRSAIVRVANAEMGRALRVISRRARPRPARVRARRVRRRRRACTPARWPRSSASRRVLVPRAGGVLSALGLAISDVRRDYVRPLLGELDELTRRGGVRGDGGAGARGPRGARAAAARGPALPRPVVRADGRGRRPRRARGPLRARPTSSATATGWTTRASSSSTLRLIATRARRAARSCPRPSRDGDARTRRRARRTSTASGTRCRCCGAPGWARAREVEGPAIVEFAEATCVVRPGWAGAVDDVGHAGAGA